MNTRFRRPTKATRQQEWRVRLRIICLTPPAPQNLGAEFGLQDNSTTKQWVIHPGAIQSNGDVHFECECRVKPNAVNGNPNFFGPFVHGATADRFLYLSWRPKAWRPGGPEVPKGIWLRRMKVRLRSITWAQIRLATQKNHILEKTVEGAGPSGPFGSASVGNEGWTVKNG
jgi:hypothetical protein